MVILSFNPRFLRCVGRILATLLCRLRIVSIYKQDAYLGVHSACREENEHNVDIDVQLFRQG